MADFQDGMMRAVRAIPGANTITKRCFYYLTQSMWRKNTRIRVDRSISSGRRSTTFLFAIGRPGLFASYRCACRYGTSAGYLSSSSPTPDYFDRTDVSGGNGVQPIFSPHTWNVHQQTLDYNPRTNIVVEGWNNKMRVAMNYHHPTTSKVNTL